MLSPTLTLLHRSLRQDSRLAGPHLVRLLLVGVILWFLWQAHGNSLILGAPGLAFFQPIVWLNFLFITLAGVSYFATAITEEKEELTLGLLRMAGIGPLSILLGKSTSRLVGGVLCLSVQFPFILLAITLGGVLLHQVLAAYLSLLAYLLLVANLGLFCSVLGRNSRSACMLAGLLLAAWLVVPFALRAALQQALAVGNVTAATPLVTEALAAAEWLLAANAFQRLQAIMTTGFSLPLVDVQVVSNMLGAAAIFVLSWATFDLLIREEQPASPGRGLLVKRASRLQRLGTRRCWRNALMWKDFHFIAGGTAMVLAKFAIYGLLVAMIAYVFFFLDANGSWSQFDWEDFAGMTMLAMLTVAGLEVAVYASRIFQEEIQWQTLSSILMLPLPVSTIVYSKIAGCLLALIPALAYFLIAALIDPDLFLEGLKEALTDDEPIFFFVQYILFVHLVAFFSLVVRWGALPLAFVVQYLGVAGCIVTFSVGPQDGELLLMIFVELLLTVFLHRAIGRELRALAAR